MTDSEHISMDMKAVKNVLLWIIYIVKRCFYKLPAFWRDFWEHLQVVKRIPCLSHVFTTFTEIMEAEDGQQSVKGLLLGTQGRKPMHLLLFLGFSNTYKGCSKFKISANFFQNKKGVKLLRPAEENDKHETKSNKRSCLTEVHWFPMEQKEMQKHKRVSYSLELRII